MNLTEVPDIVHWPETHYVFVEKIGPFAVNAPSAWQTAHTLIPALTRHNRITGYLSLYKMGPSIYRAGFALSEEPADLPAGLTYEKLDGGKYSRFVLTGPYSNLGAATRRVSEIVSERKISMRDDYCIENYVTDPRTTPEDQNVTEIFIPMA